MLMQCHSAMIVNRSTEPWSSRAESLWLATYRSTLILTSVINPMRLYGETLLFIAADEDKKLCSK